MSLKQSLAKAAFAAPLVLAFAANANAAEEVNCYTRPADIEAVKARMLAEGMLPVISHFKNVGTNEQAKWAMATLMYHPQTKKGYEWAKLPSGLNCVGKTYSNIELYSYLSLNPKAFLDKATSPRANDISNGNDYATMGMNTALLVNEQKTQFPMYRAMVNDVFSPPGYDFKTPKKYIEFLVGNPTTKEGTVLAANFNGKMIPEYYGVVGTPAKDGVQFGAIYSPVGEELLGLNKK